MTSETPMKFTLQAIQALSAVDLGPMVKDLVGWNAFDGPIGRELSTKIQSQEKLNPRDWGWVLKALPKYRKQLIHWQEVEKELASLREAREEGEKEQLPRLALFQGKFILHTRFQDRELAKSLPGVRWNPQKKFWSCLASPKSIAILRSREQEFAVITPEALEKIHNMDPSPSPTSLGFSTPPLRPLTTEDLPPLKTRPYAHQLQAYQLGITIPQAALLMEQGTGKTLAAIGIAGHRFQRGQVKRLLIVAPLSVLGEWKRQFQEHADFPVRIEVLTGSLDQRKQLLRGWVDTPDSLEIILLNYEATWRMDEEIQGWKPDMIIADESQRIKNSQAKQSKALAAWSKLSPFRLILTGTPLAQGPLDFFAQYRFLNPDIFGKSFYRFRSRYAHMGGYGGYQILGYRNLEELAAKAHSIAYRVTKEEALDLPETVDQNLFAELEPQARKLYEEMKRKALLSFGDEHITAPIVLTKMLRLQQITGGFLPGEDSTHIVSQAKLNVLKEALEDLLANPERKVVIFARFIPEVMQISNYLTSVGIPHCRLVGGVPGPQRQTMIEEFQKDPEVRIFLSQIATGGLGITLTAADTAIFYSLDFSLANYEQAKARIHRIGQGRKVTYIHILAENTLDAEIVTRLTQKQDVAKMVVDDLKNILKGECKMTEKKSLETVLEEIEQTLAEASEEAKETDLKETPVSPPKKKGKVRKPSSQDNPPAPQEEPGKGKKSDKTPKDGVPIITVKGLADELGMDPRKLRRLLRDRYGKAEGRWEWAEDSPQLAQLRDELSK